MTWLYWGIGLVAAIGILFFMGAKANKKSCLRAYGQGIQDASSLAWIDVQEKYRSFLKPMRPIDAAAYKRGLEYCLLSKDKDTWETMKEDFSEAWSSGSITAEGTRIRTMGIERASNAFKLKIPENLENLISDNPNSPPIAAKIQLEDSST